jgi:hypothetical protein
VYFRGVNIAEYFKAYQQEATEEIVKEQEEADSYDDEAGEMEDEESEEEEESKE